MGPTRGAVLPEIGCFINLFLPFLSLSFIFPVFFFFSLGPRFTVFLFSAFPVALAMTLHNESTSFVSQTPALIPTPTCEKHD